jgi:hypothetical protein
MISTGRMVSGCLAALAALALTACSKTPPPSASTAAPTPPPAVMPKPVASVLDLMSGSIAPTADFVWGAVGETSGPKGPIQKQPGNDKEWAEVRRQVLALAEAANLLAVEARHVGLPGQKPTNPPGPGDLTPEQSEAKIKADWQTFLVYAQALQNAAVATLKTVDEKNVDAYSEAGGAIDEACEQCHKRFWYPDAPKPAP